MSALAQRVLDALDTYLLRPLPARLVAGIRKRIWKLQGATVGPGVVVGTGVRVVGKSGLVLEARVSIARDVTLDARGTLTLREASLIGFESIILTSTHRSDEVGVAIQDQGMFESACEIGARAWLGTRVIIQPGTRIGADAIIGSGAVVTRDVPDRAIAAGVPCRVIRER